jgi:tetratricopeptide (TPR) repeat protein
VSLNQGKDLPYFLRSVGNAYGLAGFPEKKKYYHEKAFKLDTDSIEYFNDLADEENNLKNFKKAIELYKKCYKRDSTNVFRANSLSNAYCADGQFDKALKYVKKYEDTLYGFLYYSGMKFIGYVYWQNGYKKEAEVWFDKQKKLSEESLKLGRIYSTDAHNDLAGVYAFLGEKEKAFEHLRMLSKIHVCPIWLRDLKNDPLLISIRKEPEFKKITGELEAKFQAEHERVRKWLEEQGML